jgi:putative transposase
MNPLCSAHYRRYLFKLYPTKAQAAKLDEQRKMMADLWNALKQRIEDTYRREARVLSYFDLTNEITGLRHECPEWAQIPAVSAHRVAKWLVDSYAAFFRRLKTGEAPGYPRWQRRERGTTIPLGRMDKTGWRIAQRRDNPLSWRLHYKSVTEARTPQHWLHGRGKLPGAPLDWRNADIIWRDGRWWLSLCVALEPRRTAGRASLHIVFDLIDCFARVGGIPEEPPDFARLSPLQDDIDQLKSERDQRWPHRRSRNDAEQQAFADANAQITQLSGYLARVRRNTLHVWTARILARASDLTIVAPSSVRRETRSPRGDAKNWGANVEMVSTVNRHILAQAPAMAIAMLKYKAQEAGIRCDVISDAAPAISIGGDLAVGGKQLRRARRELRRAA